MFRPISPSDVINNRRSSREDPDEDILQRIERLETKLDLIIKNLQSVENGTNKMTSHIDFINDIYSRVQTPLFWICDRVNYMRGYKVSYMSASAVTDKTATDINDQD